MKRTRFSFALCTGMLLIILLHFIACHSTKPLGRSDGKNKPKDSSTVKKPDDGPSEFFQ